MAHLGKICWQAWPLSGVWELEFSETYHNSQIRAGHCAHLCPLVQIICTSNVFSAKHLFLSKSLKFVMLVEGAYMANPQYKPLALCL